MVHRVPPGPADLHDRGEHPESIACQVSAFRPVDCSSRPGNFASRPSGETTVETVRITGTGARRIETRRHLDNGSPLPEVGFPDGPKGNNLLTSFPSARPSRDGHFLFPGPPSTTSVFGAIHRNPISLSQGGRRAGPVPGRSPTLGSSLYPHHEATFSRSLATCRSGAGTASDTGGTGAVGISPILPRGLLRWSSDESSRGGSAERHHAWHHALRSVCLPRPARTRVI